MEWNQSAKQTYSIRRWAQLRLTLARAEALRHATPPAQPLVYHAPRGRRALPQRPSQLER